MEYSEMKKFLKDNNTTEEEMQEMWDYCLESDHKLIVQLDRCGKSWSDMNTQALSTLRTEYGKLKHKLKIGFVVPVWRNKPFDEFSDEELLEYWFRLRLVAKVNGCEVITKDSSSADMYVAELQNQILGRMSKDKGAE